MRENAGASDQVNDGIEVFEGKGARKIANSFERLFFDHKVDDRIVKAPNLDAFVKELHLVMKPLIFGMIDRCDQDAFGRRRR